MNKYIAVETYFPQGWKAEVLVRYAEGVERYVPIDCCPLFKTPKEALDWAREDYEWGV